MVNVVKIMTQPYMMVGKLAKGAVCGAGDLIDNACTSVRKKGCGCGVVDNLNPCHRDTTDDRDSSESGPFG